MAIKSVWTGIPLRESMTIAKALAFDKILAFNWLTIYCDLCWVMVYLIKMTGMMGLYKYDLMNFIIKIL